MSSTGSNSEMDVDIDPGNPNWEFLSMISNYRQDLQMTPLRDCDPVEDHQITVCVRKRPLNKKGIHGRESHRTYQLILT